MAVAKNLGVYRRSTTRFISALLLSASLATIVHGAPGEPDPAIDAKKKAAGLLGTDSSMLTEKQQRRVLTRCDRLAVSFYLSEPGRFSSGAEETEDFRSAGRYAARKILSSQLEVLQPEILDQWREYAVGLRSRQTHGGEVDATERKFDLDVGLRSGRPFVGTNVAKTRITLEWDWRRDTTKLSATRRLGEVSTRFEIRHEDGEPEVRVGLGIPVQW